MCNFFCAHFRPIEVLYCGFRAHSSIPKPEVDPLATRVWVSVQLLYMMSRTIFSALELKP